MSKPQTITEIFNLQGKMSIDGIENGLSNGLDIDYMDSGGRTLLMQSAIENETDVASFLVKKGANVNSRDSRSWTALHFAAQNGSLQMTKLLVENGSDINAADDTGSSVLSRAVFSSRGFGDLIVYLLQNGADANQANKYGITPIGLAASISNYDVLKFFQS